MLRKSLILRLFDAFSIQRWNDKIRPVELTEMDKNAHKMVIAFCLAKYEEDSGTMVNWTNIIKGGIFELLRRVVLSDIKSPVYRSIKVKRKEVFLELNKWVFSQLEPCIDNTSIKKEFQAYLKEEEVIDPLSSRILAAAHIYASYWEFQIIKQISPDGYQMKEIDKLMLNDIEEHLDLIGMRKIITKQKILNFIELVGQLRFQIRWSHTPRIPSTSVLGHSMMVASLSYLLSTELCCCDERLKNNFFGGLFHDLPESVTRDIISPVKGAVPELSEVIGQIEKEMAETEIYPLIEASWKEEFTYFTENEFESKIIENGEIKILSTEEITQKYNENKYKPIDGQITKIADHLAAFVEAYKANETGIHTPQMEEGRHNLLAQYRGQTIGGLNIGNIYADF